MFLLHGFKAVDIAFFIICAVIIVLCVVAYFLIPVFKAKQYAEARQNLEKREKVFRENQTDETAENVKVDNSASLAKNQEFAKKTVAIDATNTPNKEANKGDALGANEANANRANPTTKDVNAPAKK